jgi:hypothetical protein
MGGVNPMFRGCPPKLRCLGTSEPSVLAHLGLVARTVCYV